MHQDACQRKHTNTPAAILWPTMAGNAVKHGMTDRHNHWHDPTAHTHSQSLVVWHHQQQGCATAAQNIHSFTMSACHNRDQLRQTCKVCRYGRGLSTQSSNMSQTTKHVIPYSLNKTLSRNLSLASAKLRCAASSSQPPMAQAITAAAHLMRTARQK